MRRDEFFDLVRKHVVLASGNGPLAADAAQKIAAAADELVASAVQQDLFAASAPAPAGSSDMIPRADVLFRIRAIKGELAGLIQKRGNPV